MNKNQMMKELWNILEICNKKNNYYRSTHSVHESKLWSIKDELDKKRKENIIDADKADGCVSALVTWFLTIAATIYYTTIDHWGWAAILFVPTFLVSKLIGKIIEFISLPIIRANQQKRQKNYINSEAYKQSIAEIEKRLAFENNVFSESQRVLNEINYKLNNALTAATFIPSKYRHIEAISQIYRYFQDGRADTLKEAINLYETDIYRNEVIQQQENLIYQQAMQHQELEEQFGRAMKEMQDDINIKNKHLNELEKSNEKIQNDLDQIKWNQYLD